MAQRLSLCVVILVWLARGAALAQDAVLSGTIVDDSKSVLPGVTITATEQSTGRHEGVSEGGGPSERGRPPSHNRPSVNPRPL